MAADTNTDIVELIIDAKNLSSDELKTSAQDVKALGDAATKAETDLKKLKIQQDTIASYDKVGLSVAELRKELATAEVAYENLSKSVKANKAATDDDRTSVKLAKVEVTDLKRTLTAQEAEYRKLAKSVKAYGVDTKDTSARQQELTNEIDKADTKVKDLTSEYQKQITTLREKVNIEKAALASSKERQNELDELVKSEGLALEAERKRAAAEASNAAESQKSTAALKSYTTALEELTFKRDEGRISQSQYIQAEANLRSQLNLTEAQVKTSKQVINAESVERKQNAKAINDQTVAIKAQEKELQDLIDEEQKSLDITRRREAAERGAAEEAKRVALALKQYEAALSQLNIEKSKGVISTADYIRKEAELRTQMRLTESQVKTSKAAIQAEAAERDKSTRSADLLTTATRRIAQAYTVLLAAQKAVQAVGTGVENYVELEKAITKVEKTTGLARIEVEKMADELKDLAQNVTPTSTNELLRMAEVAGQLGTKSTADIMNLVVAADALGLSTNLAGDEAATMLARILGMTKEGIPNIQNLSSAVVALGNDFAITEADIVHMTKEIVSGTREINLGSAAAAAFGTTLAELGQPAERSRTAIQRLAGAINEASKQGGNDLERLTKITGQTAEQIEKDLGTTPETALVKFLEGLQRVKSEGGLVSDVLKSMGIDGTEATGVLSVLADGTDRLKVALELSNKAFEAGNYHMKEAIKAYADQESSIGRLSNQFKSLTTDIGEAFSDETDEAIRATNQVLKDVNDDVVKLMEFLPELGRGFVELATDLDTLFGDGGVGDNLGAIEQAGLIASNAYNSLSFAVLKAGSLLSDLQVGLLEYGKTASEISGIEFVTQEQITNATNRSKELNESVRRDLDDIINNTKRMNGESSIAYEGLVSNAAKYRESLDKLSITQRNQINDILLSGTYNKDLDKTYRELTAALVRANREGEIEVEIKARQTEAAKLKATEDAKALEASTALQAGQAGVNAELGVYGAKVSEVAFLQEALNKSYADGKITADELITSSIGLYDSLKQYNVENEKSVKIDKTKSETTADFIRQRKELQDQYKQGIITQRELAIEEEALARAHAKSYEAAKDSAKATGQLSDAQIVLQDKIESTQAEIDKLTRELNKGNLSKKESAQLTAKLAKEEVTLAEAKRQATELAKIEGATYQELIVMQREYQQQLAIVEAQFQAGIITKQQYDAATQSLAQTLNILNAILGKNTDEVEKNNKALERNLRLKGIQVDEAPKVLQYQSLELAAAAHLNKEYDVSNKTLDELIGRYNELQGSIIRNYQASVGWYENLSKISNRVFEQEQAVISQTIALRAWTEQIDSGSVSMQELGKMAEYADTYFTALSDNQMEPLIEAIEKARSDFAELKGEIDETVTDIQDRLDLALGNEKAIVKRQFEAELKELDTLIARAQAFGNQELVLKLQRSLADLKRAQDIEYKTQFAEKTPTPQAATTPTPAVVNKPTTPTVGTTTTTTTTSTTPTEVVTLRLVLGNETINATLEKNMFNRLMAEIERQKRLG